MIRLSFLMPVYKVDDKHLAASIQSIINQQFMNDWELIIVMRKTTDVIEKLCRQACDIDKRIKLFIEDDYNGEKSAANALNIALQNAVGDYITFQMGDDVAHHVKAKNIVGILDNHPNFGALCTSTVVIDNDSKVLGESPVNLDLQELKNMLSWDMPFCGVSVAWRKYLHEKIGVFRACVSDALDFDLYQRINNSSNFYAISYPLTYFRSHSGSLSEDKTNNTLVLQMILCILNNQRLLKGNGAFLDDSEIPVKDWCVLGHLKLIDEEKSIVRLRIEQFIKVGKVIKPDNLTIIDNL